MSNEKGNYTKLNELISWQLATHPYFGTPKRRGRKPQKQEVKFTPHSFVFHPRTYKKYFSDIDASSNQEKLGCISEAK